MRGDGGRRGRYPSTGRAARQRRARQWVVGNIRQKNQLSVDCEYLYCYINMRLQKDRASVTHDMISMLGESTDEPRSFVKLLRRVQQTNGAALHERFKEIATHGIRSEQSEAAEWMDAVA